MNQVLNNLKSEMQYSKKQLLNIAKSIPTTDITQQKDAMQKIAAINHAYLILEAETQRKTREAKKASVAPKHVVINGVEHTAQNQKEAMGIVCADLVKNNYKELKSNNEKLVSSNGNHFASIHKEDLLCKNPAEIKQGRKTFYYDPQRMAINNCTLFKKMLKTINVPENYITISQD